MKKFSQYVNEVLEPKQYRRLETDGDGGGGGGPSLKDLTGVNMPPDDIIAAGIAGTGGQKLNAAGLSRTPSTSSFSRAATKIKDTAYDVVNKPSIYNPMTWKNQGTEKGTNIYHARRQFEKETGSSTPRNEKEIKRVMDLEDKFAKRGYKEPIEMPEIGSKAKNIPQWNPKPGQKTYPIDPKEVFKQVVDKQAKNASRAAAAETLERTRKDREKRINDN